MCRQIPEFKLGCVAIKHLYIGCVVKSRYSMSREIPKLLIIIEVENHRLCRPLMTVIK